MRTGIILLVVAVLLGVVLNAIAVPPAIHRLALVGALIVGVLGIALILLGALGMRPCARSR